MSSVDMDKEPRCPFHVVSLTLVLAILVLLVSLFAFGRGSGCFVRVAVDTVVEQVQTAADVLS